MIKYHVVPHKYVQLLYFYKRSVESLHLDKSIEYGMLQRSYV